MRWFMHDTDASADAKIKKLLMRFGSEGYAVYFHCIELIAGTISPANITFELEHDAEIIADNLKIKGDAGISGIDKVNSIMKYIIELGLFEDRDGKIFCMKLAKRLNQSMTSNPVMRKMIADISKNHDGVMTESCKIRLDKNRIDKNKIEYTPEAGETAFSEETAEQLSSKDTFTYQQDKPTKTKDTPEERNKPIPACAADVTAYAESIGFKLDGQHFIDYYEARGWLLGKHKIKSWKACVKTWKNNDDKRQENNTTQKTFKQSDLTNQYESEKICGEKRDYQTWEADYLKKQNAVKI